MTSRSCLSTFLLGLFSIMLVATTDRCLADTTVALVIGNGTYRNVPRLINPANDALDVATALKALGFLTIVATDLGRAAFV
jgi:hypothetical protein